MQILSYQDLKNALIYRFTWTTMHDGHVCKKCDVLDGVTWETLELTPILTHPLFGDVYDLETDQSLTHGSFAISCRCFLHVEVEVDLSKVPTMANLSNEIDGVMKVMPSDVQQAITSVDNLNEKVLMLDLTSRQMLRIMYRLTALIERAGLDKGTQKMLNEAQQLIMLMRELMMGIAFLGMGTPYGWAMGALGLGLVATSGLESQTR